MNHRQCPKTLACVLLFSLIMLYAGVLYGKDSPGPKKSTVGNAVTKEVNVGSFTIKIPNEWKSFSSEEAGAFRRQYVAQSKEINQQYSGGNFNEAVDVAAFHISQNAGSFIIVSLTIPPQADLISLLKSQVDDKMAWGVREGYIHKYLGLVPVDDTQFTGFYTKAIGKTGDVQVSGTLKQKNINKNTLIQLTLLCPKLWDETRATNTLSSILESVTVKGK